MFYIARSAANTVVLTLTEKCTLITPKFLFVLTNDSTKVIYYFIAADVSIYPTLRYNRFVITEKASANTLASEVSLPNRGTYSYTIYEQSSTTNLNPLLATGIVEIGQMKVTGTEDAVTEYENENTTYAVYNG